jgi:hypothetical protein
MLLMATALLLAQACGQSGKSTGPSGNSSVAVGLKKTGGQLPQGCTGVVTATGPVTRSGNLTPSGQVTLAGLVPGTYIFSAILDCGANGTFTGQSPPVQIIDGVNNVTIEITTAPIAVGATCNPTTLNTGGTTNCSCTGSLVTGGAPTFSWSVSGPGAPGGSSSQSPSFTFPTAGSFQLVCTASNGGITKSAPPITVTVLNNAPTTGTLILTNGPRFPGDTCCSLDVTFSGPGSVPSITNLAVGASATRSGLVPGNYQAIWCNGPTAFTISAGQVTNLTLNGGDCG